MRALFDTAAFVLTPVIQLTTILLLLKVVFLLVFFYFFFFVVSIYFSSKCVIITTGTFLGGEIFLGMKRWKAGRIGEQVIFISHLFRIISIFRVLLAFRNHLKN